MTVACLWVVSIGPSHGLVVDNFLPETVANSLDIHDGQRHLYTRRPRVAQGQVVSDGGDANGLPDAVGGHVDVCYQWFGPFSHSGDLDS